MRKLVSFFVDNLVIVNVMLVTILLMGLYILKHIQKEDYPAVEMNILYISTEYPGASIRDTELLVTKKLEDYLKGIAGVSKVESYTKSGKSSILVYLNVWGPQKYDTMQSIREAVSGAQGSFPKEVKLPVIRELKGNSSAIIRFQVNSKVLNELELYPIIKEFEQRIENVKGVSSVDISGLRDREVHIMFDNAKLAKEDVSILDLKRAISNYVVRESVGTLYSPGSNHNISILTNFTKTNQLENINVRRTFENLGVNVSNFATIQNGLADREFYVRGNLAAGVTITVYKEDNVDSLAVADRLYSMVNDFKHLLALRYHKMPKEVEDSLNILDTNPVFTLTSTSIRNYFVDYYGSTVNIIAFDDTAKDTKQLLNVTKDNAILGMSLVFIVLWIFLDLRIAFWTSVGIPFALTITLLFVYFAGYSINNILLFGVIAVLGILVDDAIVMSENIYRLRSQGLSPREAAVQGSLQLIVPLCSTLMTTVFAFLPLILVKDLDFLFVRQMPIVIILCLLASFIEVLLSLPAHISHAKATKNYDDLENVSNLKWGDKLFIYLKSKYQRLISLCLKRRYWIVSFFIFLLVVAVFLFQNLGFDYYPDEENTEIDIRLYAPSGTTLENMSDRVHKVESSIVEHLGGLDGKTLDMMFTTIGSSNIAPSDMSASEANTASIVLFLKSVSKNYTAKDIVNELKSKFSTSFPFYTWLQIPYIKQEPLVQQFFAHPSYVTYQKLVEIYQNFQIPNQEVLFGYDNWLADYETRKLKVTNIHINDIYKEEINDWTKMNLGFTKINIREPSFGPRQSDPLSFLIKGNDDEMRDKVISNLYHYLKKVPGVYSIEENRVTKNKEVFLNLDSQKMNQLGITAADVAESVKTGFSGTQVGSIVQAGDSISILLILGKDDRALINNIGTIPIPSKYHKVIPLNRIVNVELHEDLKRVVRENGQRISSLSAAVDTSVTDINKVNDLVRSRIPSFIADYPGVNIEISGQGADLDEMKEQMSVVTVIGIIGIFFTLLLTFRSVTQPVFVLLTIPFGIVGVIFAFYLHGEPFSFFAIVGTVGLSGVVINSAIVMIDSINKLQQEGKITEISSLVSIGASDRFRAVLLTMMTSVVGLLPTVYGIGSSVSVLRPLAMSMAYGVMFGTIITLFFVPCIYMINEDLKKLFLKIESYGEKIIRTIKRGRDES